jgi:hypothetical protein
MNPYNSLGQYTLFGSANQPPARAKPVCPPPLQRDVKYTVLKNPPAAVKSRPSRTPSLNKSITIGTHKYVIDPVIYAKLLEIIGDVVVTSLQQLQQFIALARLETGTVACNPKVTAVRLIRQYTYLGSTGSSQRNSQQNTQSSNPVKMSYPHPYKIGEPTATPNNLLNFLYELVDIYDLPIHGVYPTTYFLEVVRDNNLGYTHNYLEMFPDGSASKYGTMIQPIPSLNQFQANPSNKQFVTAKLAEPAPPPPIPPYPDYNNYYWPIICVARPDSWNIYGGKLTSQIALVCAVYDGDGKLNYVYTPLPFAILVENVIYDRYDVSIDLFGESSNLPTTTGNPTAYDYPVGTNLRFITTNGGLFYNRQFLENVQRKFNLVQNVNYKSMKFKESSEPTAAKPPCPN